MWPVRPPKVKNNDIDEYYMFTLLELWVYIARVVGVAHNKNHNSFSARTSKKIAHHCSNGSLFSQEILHIDSIFHKFIPIMAHFCDGTKNCWCLAREHPKIVKNGPIFQGKFTKWVPFSAKMTFKNE